MMASCGSDNNNHQKPADSAMASQVGYRAISCIDSSRTYKPYVQQGDPLHFRRIDVGLWYPPRPVASNSTLRFGHFLELRQDIDAIVSLDGSEVHHYGYSNSEDQDFEQTVQTPFFKKVSLSVPYLRIESNPQPGSLKKDSMYNFLSKVNAKKQVIKLILPGTKISLVWQLSPDRRANVLFQKYIIRSLHSLFHILISI